MTMSVVHCVRVVLSTDFLETELQLRPFLSSSTTTSVQCPVIFAGVLSQTPTHSGHQSSLENPSSGQDQRSLSNAMSTAFTLIFEED